MGRATGLVVVPAQPAIVFRVAKTSYGAAEPAGARHRAGCGRGPVGVGPVGHPRRSPRRRRGSRECAFAEVLAYYRRRLGRAIR